MRMIKTKILVCSISMLIISGLLLAPSVTASQVDLTPKEKMETWLNDNTDLSDPEKVIIIGWVFLLIDLMIIICGEDFGVMVGSVLATLLLFIPFLMMSSILAFPYVANYIDVMLGDMEVPIDDFLDELYEHKGLIGVALFFLMVIPLTAILCILLYPVAFIDVFTDLYEEVRQAVDDEYR